MLTHIPQDGTPLLRGYCKWVGGILWLHQPEHNRFFGLLLNECAEQPIINNQYTSVVRIKVIRIGSVMHTVM